MIDAVIQSLQQAQTGVRASSTVSSTDRPNKTRHENTPSKMKQFRQLPLRFIITPSAAMSVRGPAAVFRMGTIVPLATSAARRRRREELDTIKSNLFMEKQHNAETHKHART